MDEPIGDVIKRVLYLEREAGYEDNGEAAADAWRLANEVKRLRGELRELAILHHSTRVGSKIHDPGHRGVEQCATRTCRRVVQALGR